MKWKYSLVWLCLSCCVLASCVRGPKKGTTDVDLSPHDRRPVLQITVADGTEVALLEQQLKIEPVYAVGSTLYLFETPEISGRLREIGYTPTQADPYQVFQRVVRVGKQGDEDELLKTGVRLINREPEYWVVNGTLTQLNTLVRIGYNLSKIAPHEPRPREVKITVKNKEDVAWIGSIHVDIYSVAEEKRVWTVYGGAFDEQIDRLRKRNLEVEIISTIEGGQR